MDVSVCLPEALSAHVALNAVKSLQSYNGLISNAGN
jgi:hypothetical protein